MCVCDFLVAEVTGVTSEGECLLSIGIHTFTRRLGSFLGDAFTARLVCDDLGAMALHGQDRIPNDLVVV